MSMKYLLVLEFLFLVTICVRGIDEPASEVLHRSERQLLFPNSSVLQFNVGVGTPTPAKLITINYVFQANFQLPWNRSQIPIDILESNNGYTGTSRKKRDTEINFNKYSNNSVEGYENDGRLYHFYKYVEEVLNFFGYNGSSCVLRTLCQLGAEPLHTDDEEDLLHELAAYLLNPRNDVDHPEYHHQIYPYIEAVERGESNENCKDIYHKCSVSLLDLFTKLI